MIDDLDKPIPASPHHGEIKYTYEYKPDNTPVKCSRCKEGYRHPVGNCVLCDHGPAPGSIWFFGEPKPKTEMEIQIVLWKLFHDVWPPTLNGKSYPTPRQLSEWKIPS